MQTVMQTRISKNHNTPPCFILNRPGSTTLYPGRFPNKINEHKSTSVYIP